MKQEIRLYVTESGIEVEGKIPMRELVLAQHAGLIPQGEIFFRKDNGQNSNGQNGSSGAENRLTDPLAKVVFPAADVLPSRSLVHIETGKR